MRVVFVIIFYQFHLYVDNYLYYLGAFKFLNGEYIVPCRHMDTMPNIDFTLNSVVYTLTPQDYVMKIEAEGNNFVLK